MAGNGHMMTTVRSGTGSNVRRTAYRSSKTGQPGPSGGNIMTKRAKQGDLFYVQMNEAGDHQ
jgi:hypothetical protein